jgi:hypothetical protein
VVKPALAMMKIFMVICRSVLPKPGRRSPKRQSQASEKTCFFPIFGNGAGLSGFPGRLFGRR